MYSGLDYDDSTMTLERFGFIGMDKRCFWGSIGVLWKRPLPVNQILPNTTIPTNVTPPTPPPKNKTTPPVPDKSTPAPMRLGAYEVQSRINKGNDIQYLGSKGYAFKPRIENALNQHWWITEVVPNEKDPAKKIYVVQSELNQRYWWMTSADKTLKSIAL